MKTILKFLILSLFIFSCDSPTEPTLCDENIEVELLGSCYNIETTTQLTYLNHNPYTLPVQYIEIPSEIGNLINLTYLKLYVNDLTGEIPPELGNLENLELLSLSRNELTGVIPIEIGSLTNLEKLYLNDNQLNGAIPSSIENLVNLEELLLHDNQLSGEIPQGVCNLIQNNNLNINNILTGNNLTNTCD